MKLSRLVLTIGFLCLAMAAPVSAAVDVPIKGTVLGGGGPDFAAPGCSGAIWRFNSSGSGNMSHLGKVGYTLSHCTYPDFSFGGGEITFTAANRDTLVIAQEGFCVPVTDDLGEFIGFTCEGTWIVVDGTGRFANATGSGSLDIIGDVPGGDGLFGLPDGMLQTHFTGRIAYQASGRSAR